MFRTTWVHSGPFGCLTKLGAKWAELVQKFVPFACICDHSVALQNSGQNVLNKCKSSWHEDVSEFFATNTPDPPHWTLNTCFGAFLTICVHLGPLGCLTKLGAKTFRISAKVRATRSRRSFSRRTHPIHPIGSHVLVGFIPFGCVWDRLVALRNSVRNRPN